MEKVLQNNSQIYFLSYVYFLTRFLTVHIPQQSMATKRSKPFIAVENLRTRALTHIQVKLLEGKLTWGDRVSEEEIAREMGISRTPVREALNHYSQIGIFERLHRVGTVLKMPELRDVEELYDIRAALECFALAETMKFITLKEIKTLEGTCDAIRKLELELNSNGDLMFSQEQAIFLFDND